MSEAGQQSKVKGKERPLRGPDSLQRGFVSSPSTPTGETSTVGTFGERGIQGRDELSGDDPVSMCEQHLLCVV